MPNNPRRIPTSKRQIKTKEPPTTNPVGNRHPIRLVVNPHPVRRLDRHQPMVVKDRGLAKSPLHIRVLLDCLLPILECEVSQDNLRDIPANREDTPTNLEVTPTNLAVTPTNLEDTPTNLGDIPEDILINQV